jgi:hypothetical protein
MTTNAVPTVVARNSGIGGIEPVPNTATISSRAVASVSAPSADTTIQDVIALATARTAPEKASRAS